MFEFPLTTLAVIAALLVYFGVSTVVGLARAKYNCPAPASGGHPEFDKRYRVQMNTLEQMAMFLPAVWMAAPVLGDPIAAAVAAVWSIGRIVYARAYYGNPESRSLGFLLTLLPTLVLIIAAGYGAITDLI